MFGYEIYSEQLETIVFNVGFPIALVIGCVGLFAIVWYLRSIRNELRGKK